MNQPRMILKRYGSQLQSVTPNFDPRAMNEIGFRKSEEHSIPAAEFTARYEQAEVHELTASAEGHVQAEAEAGVLAELEKRIDQLRNELHDGEVLVIESESGRDYPKLREKVSNIILEGSNKLHFHRTVDPPLRIAVYRPRQI